MSRLAASDFSVGIRDKDQAGMLLPAALLQKVMEEKLEITFEKVEDQKKGNSKKSLDSDVYKFLLRAGDEEVTQFGTKEVTLWIPIKKMVNPQPYYFDEKKKQWLQVKSSKGKIAEVTKGKSVASFQTPHFTDFKLTDSPITRLTVKPSKSQLEPGAEMQLSVIGTSNKKDIDLTKAEDGTQYTSSKPKIVSVDENGLIHVTDDAMDGTRVTITIRNGTKTSRVTLTIATKKVSSVSVTPKKANLEPGETLQLKTIAKMSDDSVVDVTPSVQGTTYSSSDEDNLVIDENGVVTVHEGAEKGKRVTITVTHSKKTARISITIK